MDKFAQKGSFCSKIGKMNTKIELDIMQLILVPNLILKRWVVFNVLNIFLKNDIFDLEQKT